MEDIKNVKNTENVKKLENLENLENTELYKSTLNYSNKIILNNFLNLIKTYQKYILKNEENTNNNFLNTFFDRGLNALMIIFMSILKRTNYLELAYYHCEKSIYYYNEFFSQITNKNNFISMKCNDAIMFLYKKSIYRLARLNPESCNQDQFKTLNICLKIIVLMVKSKQSIEEIEAEIPVLTNKSCEDLEEVLTLLI